MADVAPYTGAWIEIESYYIKNSAKTVAPYTGAWIEIAHVARASRGSKVAPYTGAWIEMIVSSRIASVIARRTLHGCVD